MQQNNTATFKNTSAGSKHKFQASLQMTIFFPGTSWPFFPW